MGAWASVALPISVRAPGLEDDPPPGQGRGRGFGPWQASGPGAGHLLVGDPSRASVSPPDPVTQQGGDKVGPTCMCPDF